MHDDQDAQQGHPLPEPTFAQRLDRLFATMHPKDRGPFTYADVEAGVRELARAAGDPEGTVSASYVCNLRRGRRTNPTLKQVKNLARFFMVPVTYFTGTPEEVERIDAQLALVEAIREHDVRDIARRTADLSPAGRQAVSALITSLGAACPAT